MTHELFAEHALLPSGWVRNVTIKWDNTGNLIEVSPHSVRSVDASLARGPVLAGMPNLHSHAFQRSFAGLTEYRGAPLDSFWSWRSLMYSFALRLNPEQIEAIATWLYIEMLEAGYTSVCEFHYLHHDTDGRPYQDDAALSTALICAARAAGIGLTLLPVLYQCSGFGSMAPQDSQRRFIRSSDSMIHLLQTLHPVCVQSDVRLGLAPHSLRAVKPEGLQEVLRALDSIDPTAPIHIHIAEQTAEVKACVEWSGQRPVEWLLNHVDVNQRWCLVHATHMTAGEYRRGARSGAVAGLCPSTEANLGDGIFNLPAWRKAGGIWGIGSDSHATVNAAEEFMLLEYGQRLKLRQRNVLVDAEQPQVATSTYLQSLIGGAQASGRPIAGLVTGQRADFLILDAEHLALDGLSAPEMLAAHVFASHRTSAIAEVWVNGCQLISEGRHPQHDAAVRAFIQARRQLLSLASR